MANQSQLKIFSAPRRRELVELFSMAYGHFWLLASRRCAYHPTSKKVLNGSAYV